MLCHFEKNDIFDVLITTTFKSPSEWQLLIKNHLILGSFWPKLCSKLTKETLEGITFVHSFEQTETVISSIFWSLFINVKQILYNTDILMTLNMYFWLNNWNVIEQVQFLYILFFNHVDIVSWTWMS